MDFIEVSPWEHEIRVRLTTLSVTLMTLDNVVNLVHCGRNPPQDRSIHRVHPEWMGGLEDSRPRSIQPRHGHATTTHAARRRHPGRRQLQDGVPSGQWSARRQPQGSSPHVQAAVTSLDYRPDHRARLLRQTGAGTETTIGFVLVRHRRTRSSVASCGASSSWRRPATAWCSPEAPRVRSNGSSN